MTPTTTSESGTSGGLRSWGHSALDLGSSCSESYSHVSGEEDTSKLLLFIIAEGVGRTRNKSSSTLETKWLQTEEAE